MPAPEPPVAPPALVVALTEDLATLAREDRLRRPPEIAGADRRSISAAGRPLLSFCSNDYLGLAAHPALREAAARSLATTGVGAGSARLVAGAYPEHRALEAALATWLATPAALLFPTGYQANVGLITALAGPDDLLVSDAANHASLIDGCRLSRARIAIYPHGDVSAAHAALATPGPFRRRFLITESLFSMDGDTAPLTELAAAARATDAALLVDEAHALGVLGPAGAGLAAAARIRPFATVGTLGKALGAAGGFVAGDQVLIDTLVNRARTFIFTTAAPPSIAAAALAGLELARGPEGDERRRALAQNIRLLQSTLPGRRHQPPGPSGPSPIVPILLGTPAAAVAVALALHERGFFVPAIRPPTVPEGTARLRVTLSAAHTEADVTALAAALAPLLATTPAP